jgi:hypothetical protein
MIGCDKFDPEELFLPSPFAFSIHGRGTDVPSQSSRCMILRLAFKTTSREVDLVLFCSYSAIRSSIQNMEGKTGTKVLTHYLESIV